MRLCLSGMRRRGENRAGGGGGLEEEIREGSERVCVDIQQAVL